MRKCIHARCAVLSGSIFRVVVFGWLAGWACGLGWAQTRMIPGITSPVTDATLSASVPGLIRIIHVEEGDAVTNNQVLVELDKEIEQFEVERRLLVWDSKVEVESAEAAVQTVETDLAGTRRLFETTGSVSKEELEQKVLEHKMAVAEWNRLKIVEQREEIEHRMALEQLARRDIRSPTDGIVTEVILEEGENCEARQPLIRVVDVSRCYFTCNADAPDVASLRPGQVAALELSAGTGSIGQTGTVFYVAPVVDPASGLRQVKVIFENPDGRVQPGVSGFLRIGEDGHGD